VTDHDQLAFFADRGLGQWLRRQIVLGDGLQRAQELTTGRCDLPAFGVTQHVAIAKDVEFGNPRREAPDPRMPILAARREDSEVVLE